jgi:hypothetical protein
MSAEQVALIPQCEECGAFWLPGDQERWRAYLDTDDEVVIFCLTARRESSTPERLDELPLAANRHRRLAFDLPAPIVAVLLDPPALGRAVGIA